MVNTIQKNRQQQRDFRFEKFWDENKESLLILLLRELADPNTGQILIQDISMEKLKDKFKSCWLAAWKEHSKIKFSSPHENDRLSQRVIDGKGSFQPSDKYEQ